ncbi:ribbon-helix-helix protein, CopG family [Kocuria rosea]|uniref:ribbon-helix-helix protein, CopG family n=1 Tax=Kocuria rosea TaxID=1275 RepID=UPI003D34305E
MTDQTRLNVNLNAETAETLRELASRHGISYTEAIRRSVSIYKFFDEEQKKGRRIQTMNTRGRKRMDVMLP